MFSQNRFLLPFQTVYGTFGYLLTQKQQQEILNELDTAWDLFLFFCVCSFSRLLSLCVLSWLGDLRASAGTREFQLAHIATRGGPVRRISPSHVHADLFLTKMLLDGMGTQRRMSLICVSRQELPKDVIISG